MDRFVVHERTANGRAVHSLVIGVGAYPNLLGGTGTRTDSHDGMGQLSSPPQSARKMADWLIQDHAHPDFACGTVALLLSEAQPTPYVNPDTGVQHDVEAATYQNIADAISDWKIRGDIDPDDMLIFFFCGHGISQGDSMVLLPEDFGANPNNAYDTALDFLKVYDAMQQAQARWQCFFVDACRASSDNLGANNARSPLAVKPRAAPGSRIGPIYYSTLKGADAHGRPGAPSIFTEALLASLRDFGATDEEGDWRVSNYALSNALEFMLDRAEINGNPVTQVPASTKVHERFYICHLDSTPKANLVVSGRPEERLAQADLTCRSNGTILGHRAPAPGPDWSVPVPSDVPVKVEPKLAGEATARTSVETRAHPPFKKLKLDLS